MNTPSLEKAFIGELDVTPPPPLDLFQLERYVKMLDQAVGVLIHQGDELVFRLKEIERRFSALIGIAYPSEVPDILRERLPMEGD